MLPLESIDQALETLISIHRRRHGLTNKDDQPIRAPVGLFLVREDGAAGSKLATEIVGSFGYWHLRSAQFFDAVFLGWGYEEGPRYLGHEVFDSCIKDLENRIEWHYLGRSQLLIVDFIFHPKIGGLGHGEFDFSSAMDLDISELLDDKRLPQLSSLIEEIVRSAKELKVDDESPVAGISDYIALLRSRRFWWNELIKRFGVILGWADELKPYAVRDLRKAQTKH